MQYFRTVRLPLCLDCEGVYRGTDVDLETIVVGACSNVMFEVDVKSLTQGVVACVDVTHDDSVACRCKARIIGEVARQVRTRIRATDSAKVRWNSRGC